MNLVLSGGCSPKAKGTGDLLVELRFRVTQLRETSISTGNPLTYKKERFTMFKKLYTLRTPKLENTSFTNLE